MTAKVGAKNTRSSSVTYIGNITYIARLGVFAPNKLCWKRHLLPLGAETVRVCVTDGHCVVSVQMANVHKP